MRLLRIVLWFAMGSLPSWAAAQIPLPICLPRAGQSYVDPVTNNRVWRVTEDSVCARAARHFYSYWPVWNQDGTHLLIECEGWSQASSNALLIRDKDFKVLGDALRGASGLNRGSRCLFSSTMTLQTNNVGPSGTCLHRGVPAIGMRFSTNRGSFSNSFLPLSQWRVGAQPHG